MTINDDRYRYFRELSKKIVEKRLNNISPHPRANGMKGRASATAAMIIYITVPKYSAGISDD